MIGLLSMLASLFGCARPKDPFMLDGPGMVYIDSDYRTDYANTLPFDEPEGDHLWAVEYIGSGEEGCSRRDSVVAERFGSLGEEAIAKVEHADLGGEYWFLVIPRYNDIIEIYPAEGDPASLVSPYGYPFTVCCRDGAVVKNGTNAVSTILFTAEDGGVPVPVGDVWDITDGY